MKFKGIDVDEVSEILESIEEGNAEYHPYSNKNKAVKASVIERKKKLKSELKGSGLLLSAHVESDSMRERSDPVKFSSAPKKSIVLHKFSRTTEVVKKAPSRRELRELKKAKKIDQQISEIELKRGAGSTGYLMSSGSALKLVKASLFNKKLKRKVDEARVKEAEERLRLEKERFERIQKEKRAELELKAKMMQEERERMLEESKFFLNNNTRPIDIKSVMKLTSKARHHDGTLVRPEYKPVQSDSKIYTHSRASTLLATRQAIIDKLPLSQSKTPINLASDKPKQNIKTSNVVMSTGLGGDSSFKAKVNKPIIQKTSQIVNNSAIKEYMLKSQVNSGTNYVDDHERVLDKNNRYFTRQKTYAKEIGGVVDQVERTKRFGINKVTILASLFISLLIGGGAFAVMSKSDDIVIKMAAGNAGITSAKLSYLPEGYNLVKPVGFETGTLSIVYAKGDEQVTFEQFKSDSNLASLKEEIKSIDDTYTTFSDRGLTVLVFKQNEIRKAAWLNNGKKQVISVKGDSISDAEMLKIVSSITE